MKTAQSISKYPGQRSGIDELREIRAEEAIGHFVKRNKRCREIIQACSCVMGVWEAESIKKLANQLVLSGVRNSELRREVKFYQSLLDKRCV